MTAQKPLLKLGGFLPYRLSVISNRISAAIAEGYEDRFSLSLPEWRIMAILGEDSDLSAAQVSERTAMDKVAVSRAVSRLLEAGHLERQFAEDDRRRSVLRLSKSGKETYAQIAPMAIQYEQDLLSKLSTEERDTLHRLLDKIAAAAEDIQR